MPNSLRKYGATFSMPLKYVVYLSSMPIFNQKSQRTQAQSMYTHGHFLPKSRKYAKFTKIVKIYVCLRNIKKKKNSEKFLH